MGLANRSNQKTNKEIAVISEKIKSSRLSFSDLMIPIIVVVVLLLLSVFVFVPMINAALQYQEERKETNVKIEQLNSLQESLNKIDDNQLSDDIVLAKSVIPKILKVSDFIYYVDTLAKQKGLLIRELSAGDMVSKISQTENSGAGVSGPISYVGTYEAVVDFLDEVQNISPYIIRIQNVEVASLASGQWSISLNVSGYYMADKMGNVNIYRPFKSYTDYEDILEIFREKAKNL